jgi:hypothetical protein
MKEVITMSIERLLLTDPSSKVVKGTSSKVVNTTNVLDDLDWTDKEAQDLIEPSILEKFNI